MFSFSITKQLIVFLQSFGFGFLIGLVHLVTDFICSLLLPKKAQTVVSDVLFCIVFSIATYCFVLAYNLGKLRLYVILGILFGVILFSLTLGDVVSGLFLRAEGLIVGIRKTIAVKLRKIKGVFKTKLNKSIAKENKSGV